MSNDATRARSWLASILLAFVALAPSWAAADGLRRPFDRIVVFGDSLSDPGNVFALNGGQTIGAPDYGMTGVDANGIPEVVTLIPDAPYASRHFSNGHTWVEDLAAAIGLAPNARPAVAGALFGEHDGRASNYAVGGATAADLSASGGSQFPLGVQVGLFLGDVRGHAPADALYVIAIGGNDIRAALVAQNPTVVIGAALTSIATNVGRLHAAGARKFLIWNAPDVGRSPAIQRLDAVVCGAFHGCISAGATQASALYNTQLNQVLQGLGALPGISIVPFDAFGTLALVQGNPGRFGLLDATTACIRPNVPQFGFPSSPPFRCAQPDRWFFWDGIHPTRAGHAIIALLVGKDLLSSILHDQ